MESYRGLWLKGAIVMALNMYEAGLTPVEIGLGERDFYIDVQSDSALSLQESEKFAQWKDHKYEIKDGKVTYNGKQILLQGDVTPSGEPRYFKVLNISVHHPSANVQLVRIRGIAFETKEQMDDYLQWLEKASETDHRIIGERMDLFSFHEESGPGLVLFHPKGQLIRNEMINYMREINASMGYQEVYTSHVFRTVLWKISGHYDTYRDKMLIFQKDDDELGIKPMNCPAHILIYKSRVRSYRDLPIRFSEFGNVYRWEKKGELYGLLRTRGFTQDDGHIFLREDQLKDEVKNLVRKTLDVLGKFGFKGEDVRINLSTRPDESIGSDEQWEKATKALLDVLKELNVPYVVKEKEGAFYGPKIDFDIRDSLNRWWQLSTIQVDFNLPERFKLEYVDEDGSKKRPVMVHRAIYGSLDRMIAILLEHFRGKLPTWLSPVQVRVLPISEDNLDYAKRVMDVLVQRGIRTEIDPSGETLSKRIKRGYDDGVPYLVIVGRKEASEEKVTIRARGNVEIKGVPLSRFVDELSLEIGNRDAENTLIKRIG
ncbi:MULTISPECIES: threonine--tRNA ligase [Metallosphaera]|uniref:Threonine--tRNA ligase catalytic subunit n=3 Tax=Metallosphaera TaxID=41980 RepID=SYTC_METS5|nr:MULTISPECIES: threonine--tRNA ligase [Metallosphaera]A4YH38.1 RecName: Full=Threonine--tRNA ligase catalytic subunit; AltName: Full=Threonyl-tRNA synthetase catalytic subunit; Short=ThrRS-cat [Metallosphaera sedula DSM 5348]ABP95740.1 threonyl-tRNA synthetase / Ser-tRNA(Thr) hydrolase [Metallosphaera sedula DSM 5348]AIM27724.1 threonyl-tRNA synthetase / Ser-tRNA(Thr) hydrolase [Metallosphaera sedula]AKV74580.1 threonine--tRNA ligase [Metallosphaera sedula]AKV76819.1 threonine--tRNA ligase [